MDPALASVVGVVDGQGAFVKSPGKRVVTEKTSTKEESEKKTVSPAKASKKSVKLSNDSKQSKSSADSRNTEPEMVRKVQPAGCSAIGQNFRETTVGTDL